MAKAALPYETQHQRWIKYGANVALSIVLVIVVAAICVIIADRLGRRIDTTNTRAYSLKPQTLNIIRNLKSPVRIVSLYSRPTGAAAEQAKQAGEPNYAQVVADLLDEYKHDGKNIEIEAIDPIADAAKADALYDYVRNHYGGELSKYKAFFDAYPAQFDQIKKAALDEADKIKSVPDNAGDPDLSQTIQLTKQSLTKVSTVLDDAKDRIDRILKQKRPDYRRAADEVTDAVSEVSQFADAIQKQLAEGKDKKNVPDVVKQYITESAPRYAAMKKLADDLADKVKKLGELKLDDVREKLREQNAVLVMGDKEMRSLSFEQLWQPDNGNNLKRWGVDEKPRPRFAGEQQITTAILSLTEPGKKKVAIIRPGGAPLATPEIFPFQRGGPLSAVADRLRNYNFDVVEKDLSGQYAMQAQMQGQPAPPEPTDEEIKDATWIVVAAPAQDQRMGPSPPIGPKLKEHLAHGGSAMVLGMPRGDALADVLKDYGIQLQTDKVAVHEVPPNAAEVQSRDIAENAQRVPYIFVLSNYGQHLITQPLTSLDMLGIYLSPVTTSAVKDVKLTQLLPLPNTPPSWGESDMESLDSPEGPKKGPDDLPPPLYAAAVAEKPGSGRLAVIGGVQSFTNEIMNVPDVEATRAQRRFVARFPGNAEFFANTVFWLANQETLIAISPTAMEVPRIRPMSDAALAGWRVGVLLVGLPLAVIVAGMMVFFARRD